MQAFQFVLQMALQHSVALPVEVHQIGLARLVCPLEEVVAEESEKNVIAVCETSGVNNEENVFC